MTARTVGTLRWYPKDAARTRDTWGIEAAPHVMIRVKRIFPRVQVSRAAEVRLADTPDAARDIVWLLDRHPLAMEPMVRKRLEQRAGLWDSRAAALDSIMSGDVGTLDLELEPERPLRDYQQTGVATVRTVGRMILGDELGLGKTTTALGLLGDPSALPMLVVCPTHLQRQWLRELGQVWPLRRGHIVTSGRPYDVSKSRGMRGYPPDVLVRACQDLCVS